MAILLSTRIHLFVCMCVYCLYCTNWNLVYVDAAAAAAEWGTSHLISQY